LVKRHSADDLLTIRNVVRLATVSERTIRRDIAAGRLRVVRLTPRAIRVPRAAALTYRRAAHASDTLLTIAACARHFGMSRRSRQRSASSGEP
jgi:hypothetical protein